MKWHEVKLQLFSSYNRYILFHRMYSYEKIDKTFVNDCTKGLGLYESNEYPTRIINKGREHF